MPRRQGSLVGGLPRVFRDHRGVAAQRLRRAFDPLDERFTLRDDVERAQAFTVATSLLSYQDQITELGELQAQRAQGRGRRPNAAAIARMRRAVERARKSWQFSLKQLEAMCPLREGASVRRVAGGRR